MQRRVPEVKGKAGMPKGKQDRDPFASMKHEKAEGLKVERKERKTGKEMK